MGLKNKKGDGVALIIATLFIIMVLVSAYGLVANNYYLEETRETLVTAVRNGCSAAVTQIDLTSEEGMTGMSNSGQITEFDSLVYSRKHLKLEEDKALLAFLQTYRGNITSIYTQSTTSKELNQFVLDSIDKLIIIYPDYSGYEKCYDGYVIAPRSTDLGGKSMKELTKNFSLPRGNAYFSVNQLHDYATESGWFISLQDMQDSLNVNVQNCKSGYGDYEIFFSGTQAAYQQFVTEGLDPSEFDNIPLSSLDESNEPIFIAVLKGVKPKVHFFNIFKKDGILNSDDLIGEGLYDTATSHIFRIKTES